ncbi:prepilin-type N-terminal cleavage/methylation domain-containing protein [Candidatus Parcubacteria bacterium]|nr:prepilin-type N-terminal cleavage/methylation domain-containing protein [Candidatus Parcubacteria bacterium]
MIKKRNLQFGFTLIESIVAVAVFILISVVMYSVYSFNQRAYLEGEKMAELVQNGRIVIERITRELRQATDMVTVLPQTDQGAANPTEIEFQDGHIPVFSATSTAVGSSINTIVLAVGSSAITDYYKDMFLKIIDNTGQGQLRKIISYDGSTKTAIIGEEWSIVPDNTSVYRLGSEYYYIRYYIPAGENEVHRQYRVYCFDSCDDCNDYFRWDDVRPEIPNVPSACALEDRTIGEYIAPGDLKFWGSNVIDVSVRISEDNREVNLSTKVFGRNF